MQLSQDYTDGLAIQSMVDGEIIIADKSYTSNILLTTQEIFDWAVDLNNLDSGDFSLVNQLKPEIFILGTGKKRQQLSGEWLSILMNNGIGFELMDTAAACRTFNILSAENRKIMAGLIIC